MSRWLPIITLLATLGLLYELWHDTNAVALGGLVSIATIGMQKLAGK